MLFTIIENSKLVYKYYRQEALYKHVCILLVDKSFVLNISLQLILIYIAKYLLKVKVF